MEFRPLTEPDAALAATWFHDDTEGSEEMGDFFGSHPRWWTLVRDDPARHGWTVWDAESPVGFVDMQIKPEPGDIVQNGGHIGAVAEVAVYVRREARGRGVGSAITRALGPIARAVGATRMSGSIRPDNTASLRAAVASGGVIVGQDEHGYVEVLGPRLSVGL